MNELILLRQYLILHAFNVLSSCDLFALPSLTDLDKYLYDLIYIITWILGVGDLQLIQAVDHNNDVSRVNANQNEVYVNNHINELQRFRGLLWEIYMSV